jgi:hypothetical protein
LRFLLYAKSLLLHLVDWVVGNPVAVFAEQELVAAARWTFIIAALEACVGALQAAAVSSLAHEDKVRLVIFIAAHAFDYTRHSDRLVSVITSLVRESTCFVTVRKVECVG